MKKELLIVIIVGVLLIFLNKRRALQSMELRPAFPRNFRLNGISNLSFDLPFTAFNGSNGTLNIGGIDLRVYAEGQYIGRAFAAYNQQILPFGQSMLSTQVFVNLIDMASAIPGFLGGVQDQAVNMLFRGTLNVEGFYVPVEIPIAFNLPKFK
ncbi:hypothetical protein [Dyadobacter aurulentus]|uniref:hypothetical protein n=1 Tax=Dyadobacter sp. UC 10 TaxID=2605428 RepID=UPI0011F0CFAD|nr:hypothetical protein [Dyadobacter sp. UC 10]KAA0992767.1 hypothetical protein FXO21_22610 [Dyadobacter sp. UC 10]